MFGSDDDDEDGAMDDDFGGALGELSGSDPDSDAARGGEHDLLGDGSEAEAEADDVGSADEGDASDSEEEEEEGRPDVGGSGSDSEPETRAERQSRKLDRLKCANVVSRQWGVSWRKASAFETRHDWTVAQVYVHQPNTLATG